MSILTVVPAHAPRLSAFMRECFLQAYHDCSSAQNVAAHLDRYYVTAVQERELNRPDHRSLVIEQDGEWAGFAQLDLNALPPLDPPALLGAQLARFYVLSRHHGQGLAQSLMAAVREEAARHGAEQLWLTVWKRSPRAIRFYERQGFRRVGECEFLIGDDPQADWVMQAGV